MIFRVLYQQHIWNSIRYIYVIETGPTTNMLKEGGGRGQMGYRSVGWNKEEEEEDEEA